MLVRLIALIASRFGFVVSQKAAAQTIPVIGALGGIRHQLCFYRPLPVCRARPFYRATTRAKVRQRYCFRCVRAPS